MNIVGGSHRQRNRCGDVDRKRSGVPQIIHQCQRRHPSVAATREAEAAIETAPVTNAIEYLSNDTEYRKTIDKVLAAITAKDYAAAEKYFTPQGAEMFRSLINYGRARVLDTSGLTFYQNGDRVVCRNAKMSFSFRNGLRKSFVEDVVFTFDSKKRIDYIAFGLGEKAEHDILNNDEWNEATRKALMNFLENYKTAFALKESTICETCSTTMP